MALRSPVLSFALVLGGFVPCLAQQPTGSATLETLVQSKEAEATSAPRDKASTAARPAGTLVRPNYGVQHPDLDKAWADYDVAVATAIAPVTAAITKQFEAAVAKGDLDAAEHWQAAKVKFEENGELPDAPRTKAAVSAAVEDCKSANNKLIRAYEAVVKTLTTDKKLAEAKAVQAESLSIQKSSGGEVKAPYNLAREGRPSASYTEPGNGALAPAFDGVTNDTDSHGTSYWFAGHGRRKPDYLRVDLKHPATVTQIRLLTPIDRVRWLGGHEPVDYEVFLVRNGRTRSVSRVVDARHSKVEPMAGKHNVRWIVIDLPKPVPADAVVIAVAKASGDDGTGPVVFEFEVIGNYTADK